MSSYPDVPPPPYQENNTKTEFTCAICLAENVEPVKLTCCYKEGSSMVYCEECIKTSCESNNSTENLFKCPSCSLILLVKIESEKITSIEPAIGRCYRCSPTEGLRHRRHKLAKTTGDKYDDGVLIGLCTECHLADCLGNLVYECQRCQGKQAIGYPMFKTQVDSDSYSSATWACWVGSDCEYTNWKLVSEDLAKLPGFARPESWKK